ncbi:MAG TPA: DUF1573 domain-containing protein [Candidatus Paceibacterota bacterium]
METKKELWLGIGLSILVLGVIVVWFGTNNAGTPVSQGEGEVLLASAESAFDFGAISMAAGKVRHQFTVTNPTAETVTVAKMYTSCMCTEAKLIIGNKERGPFGMPGHGVVPKINQQILPGEKVAVEVEFDPAAHGPAGVGTIERSVYLEQSNGAPLELRISARVTP